MIIAKHAFELEAGLFIGPARAVVADIDVEIDPVDVGRREDLVEYRLEQDRSDPGTRLAYGDAAQVGLAMLVVDALQGESFGPVSFTPVAWTGQ